MLVLTMKIIPYTLGLQLFACFARRCWKLARKRRLTNVFLKKHIQLKVFKQLHTTFYGLVSVDPYEIEMAEWAKHYHAEVPTGKYIILVDNLDQFERWTHQIWRDLSLSKKTPERKVEKPAHWIPSLQGIPVGMTSQASSTSTAIVPVNYSRVSAPTTLLSHALHETDRAIMLATNATSNVPSSKRGYLKLRGAQDKRADVSKGSMSYYRQDYVKGPRSTSPFDQPRFPRSAERPPLADQVKNSVSNLTKLLERYKNSKPEQRQKINSSKELLSS